jgi:RNA polymerase sigma-32 factor
MLSEQEESELINTWIETRDQNVLIKLINSFEPLVLKYARRYSSYGIAKDELVAVGNLALCETADKFKPELGFKFSTYSSHWIRGMMLIFIASNYFSFTLKSQKMKHIFFTLRKLMHNEQKEAGVDYNTEEIMLKMSEHFGCPPEQLEQIYQMIRHPNLSLNEPLNRNGGSRGESTSEEGTLGDTIFTDEPDPEENVIIQSKDKFHRELIYSTMKRVLSEREQTIIKGQLLMDEDGERTLQDLADEFELSRERVRQIRNNAYAKLEKAIRNKCSQTVRRNMF